MYGVPIFVFLCVFACSRKGEKQAWPVTHVHSVPKVLNLWYTMDMKRAILNAHTL
jgi:hypothetical protein